VRGLVIGWADRIFRQKEVLNTPKVPPTIVTTRAGGTVFWFSFWFSFLENDRPPGYRSKKKKIGKKTN
jgi:hypothetical protein